MYKNLNELTDTNIDISFNNTNDLTDIKRLLNASIPFSYEDIEDGVLKVDGRVIKQCVITTPSGIVWNDLSYRYHVGTDDNGDDSYTLFDFSHILEGLWEDGQYFIIVNSNLGGTTLTNANYDNGVSLLKSSFNHNYLKKLVSGDGMNLVLYEQYILISSALHNYTQNVFSFSNNTIIDIANGNIQIFKTLSDDILVDIVNSNSQNSNLLNVTIIAFKLFDNTTLKYHDKIILQKYDTGWFAFNIKKVFGHLFISLPTRIITDYVIE